MSENEGKADALGLYQYRVLEIDSDGDPLDHGVVRAENPDSPNASWPCGC